MNVLISTITKQAKRWGNCTFTPGLWEEVKVTDQLLDSKYKWKWKEPTQEFIQCGKADPSSGIEMVVFERDGSLVYGNDEIVLVHEE